MYYFTGLLFVLACALVPSHQSVPILEKCIVSKTNGDMLDNVNLECKQTADGFLVSASGDLKTKLNLDEVDVTVQAYALENDQYVIKPTAKMTMGLCKEYKTQNLANWQEIEKYGNMVGCGTLEPGNYHVKDFPPKVKIPNVKIPAGRYKLNAKTHIGETLVYELDFFVEIAA